FGRELSIHGLAETYRRDILFNHPPLVAYYLRAIYALSNLYFLTHNNITFASLLRLPGVIADLFSSLVIWKLADAMGERSPPFWHNRRQLRPFIAAFLVTTVLLALEPLIFSPIAYAKNVLSYGSYWGLWGITYLVRISDFQHLSRISFFGLAPAATIISNLLKVVVVSFVLFRAWRDRKSTRLNSSHVAISY